jgi:hypothetical protein
VARVVPPPRVLRCRRCGEDVHRFKTEVGQEVQVDATPMSVLLDISADIADGRVWEWNGPYVRWVAMGSVGRRRRNWRPVYRVHGCHFTLASPLPFAATPPVP